MNTTVLSRRSNYNVTLISRGDGNSLGRLPRYTMEVMRHAVERMREIAGKKLYNCNRSALERIYPFSGISPFG